MGEISKSDKGEQLPESSIKNLENRAEGFRPIMACVGTYEEYSGDLSEITNIVAVGDNINYYALPRISAEKDFKNAGWLTYVISTVSPEAKFTTKLFDCTSLVAVGKELGTGIELSLLTHQDPKKFLAGEKDIFEKHLIERLEELKNRCAAGTIDIVIAGGRYGTDDPNEYQKSLELLSSAVKGVLGFEPSVISGPKESGNDNIYFDTPKRRLYVVRPDDSLLHNDNFKPREINKMKNKWEKGNKD